MTNVAFQANIGRLGIYSGTVDQWTNTNLGPMGGTSPSLAALSNGTYLTAFQANVGMLGIYGGAVDEWTNTNLGPMAGTSPSIAASD
jgi:hypothetical protein